MPDIDKKEKDEAGAEAAEKPKKGNFLQSNVVKILLGIAIVIVILAIVFFTTYYFVSYFNSRTARTPEVIGTGGIEKNEIPDPPLSKDMGQYTVIIFDENGRSYNLRVYILLTVNSKRPEKEAVTKEMGDRFDQLTDAIYEVLIATDPKSLMGNRIQRSEGMAEMKASILRAVNSRMKNKIDGVFFKEFIFQ